MLTEIYIEALLIDEGSVGQVWEAWYSGEADDQAACLAWALIAGLVSSCLDEPVGRPLYT